MPCDSCRVHAHEQAASRSHQILEALFELVGALKQRAGDREDPATVFLLRHARAGSPLRVSDLAGSSRLDVSTVSRHVKALDDAGLLLRTEDPDDRRVSRVQITEQGRALLEDAMGARAASLAEGMTGWSERDQAQLTTLLTRLARAVGSSETRPETRPDRAPLTTEKK